MSDRYEPRPLAERISGVTAVVVRAAAELNMDTYQTEQVRCVLADSMERHEALYRYLEGGGQPVLCVAEGLVPYWPEDIETDGGFCVGGSELIPIAAGTLATLGEQRDVTLDSVSRIAAHLRSYPAGQVDLAELVVIEACEALCFAAITERG